MIKKREYFNELIPVLKIKLRNCEQSRVKACETKVGRVFFIEAQILIRAAHFTRLRVKKERAISVETFTRGQLKTLDVVPFFPHNGWKILKYYLGVLFRRSVSTRFACVCIALMRTFPDNSRRMAIIPSLRHGTSGFTNSLRENLRWIVAKLREFGKFRDVTENCRSSASHLASL